MKLFYPFVTLLLARSFSVLAQNASEEEWINLFNGINLNGWEIKVAEYDLGSNPHQTFVTLHHLSGNMRNMKPCSSQRY